MQTITINSESKPKAPGPSTDVRTGHLCVLMTVYNCGTQYSTEQW